MNYKLIAFISVQQGETFPSQHLYPGARTYQNYKTMGPFSSTPTPTSHEGQEDPSRQGMTLKTNLFP